MSKKDPEIPPLGKSVVSTLDDLDDSSMNIYYDELDDYDIYNNHIEREYNENCDLIKKLLGVKDE